MNDSNQYMVQVGDYDQNTYIIQDANGLPVQYDGGAIISADIADGNNMITESRWIQQNSGRGGKIMSNQAFVNGDLVSVNGTGLNLSTRFTPSSIVLNTASGVQFDQDSLRIASAVTGTGGRGRPRGRKPSRGNFPVVPIDMVRQLGIEQQVILQPTVPVATKNKAIQTSTIQMSKKTQCNDLGIGDMGLNNAMVEPNTKYIHIPVFVPIPVPVYIPVPTFIREKVKQIENIDNSTTMTTNATTTSIMTVPTTEATPTTRVEEKVIIEVTELTTTGSDIVEKSPIETTNPPATSTEEIVSVTTDTQSSSLATLTSQEKLETPVTISCTEENSTALGGITSGKSTGEPKKRPLSDPSMKTSVAKQRKIDVHPASVPTPLAMEKKESDSCKLKYTFGINAWRHWSRNLDLLSLSVVDFNKQMVEFVQKIRKPNNEAYVPDSIFYLCLGIQLYLLEHNKDINIFVDSQFFGFQNELNKILATFKPKLGDNHVLVCRIEEDHLWESEQLGSHSPGVLLFSICYLLTKQLKFNSTEHHAILSIDQLEINDSDITFRSSDSESQRYLLCSQINTKRCFYNIVRTYIDKCTELGDKRSHCLYLKPLSKTAMESIELWFDIASAEKSILEVMLNRIRIVKEVQESLLSTN